MYKKISKNKAKHYIWGNNCNSWVFVDDDVLSVKLESMPPKTKEDTHYHSIASQFFYLIKGQAIFHINGSDIIVSTQEGIIISPLTEHFIENVSEETIEFLVISQLSTNNDRFLVN